MMKQAPGFVLAGLLASSLLASMPYYALELRGGSRVYSTDAPVRKGRLMLFHRYPDGVLMSLAAGDVEKVVAVESPPSEEKLAPGDVRFIGGALEGPGFQPPAPAAGQAPMASQPDYGYGYTGYWWGGYVPSPRPPMPGPVPPSRIGPNGFPILAPPGSPGSMPPPTGPNGFPVLAPQPPQVNPRPR